MQFKTFVIPTSQPHEAEDELNRFLRSKRVLSVERQFAAEGGGRWVLLVEYLDGEQNETARPASRARDKEREDPAKALTEEQRGRFEHYRQIRLDIAKRENIRAYMVFTDRELVAMAAMQDLSIQAIAKISGVGEKRAMQYGVFFVEEQQPLIENEADEAGGQPDGTNMPY